MKLIRSLALLVAVGMATQSGVADERVDALVRQGELGAAVRVAATIEDPSERADALDAITAAVGPLSGIREGGEDATDRAATAGGGSADFGPIIDLIQSQTGGDTWQDIGGGDGQITPFDSGIRVDPRGVISKVSSQELAGQLEQLAAAARTVDVGADMAAPAEMRVVSLTRLEAAVSELLAEGTSVPKEMRSLAGLTAVDHVFVYPESGEIVIAGPAEGWEIRGDGRTVATQSGRPTLQLDDLVTVLRTFGPGGEGVFGCSIDPRRENVAELQKFVAQSQAGGSLRPAAVRRWVQQIDETLGKADVRVYGVPATSRVAHILVDADYRMKLIGLDELEGGPDVPGYFELLAQNRQFITGGLDALRWWMTMNYSAVRHDAGKTAFELVGEGVLCQSENQHLTAEGERVPTGTAEPLNREFAANFTAHYAQLCQRETVFADLEAVLDLALAAALIEHEGLDEAAGWDRGCFAADGAYRPAQYVAPATADAVVAHRVYNGRDIVVQAAGGVDADVMRVVTDGSMRDVDESVADEAAEAAATGDRWWWNAR